VAGVVAFVADEADEQAAVAVQPGEGGGAGCGFSLMLPTPQVVQWR
jgi:hypothetical protein